MSKKRLPPSPTPAAIVVALADAGVPLAPDELAERLALDRKARRALDDEIARLHDRGEILVNRKGQLCIAAKLDLVAGRLEGHPEGYGFLIRDDGGPDVALPAREMHKALHGDRASVRVTVRSSDVMDASAGCCPANDVDDSSRSSVS